MGHLSHVNKAWKAIVEEPHRDIINDKGIGNAPSYKIQCSYSIRSEILPQKLERERSHSSFGNILSRNYYDKNNTIILLPTENCEVIISDSNKDIKFLRDHGYTV